MITCAHNLFKHKRTRLEKARFLLGQHGDRNTVLWEAKIDPDWVIIPKEFKTYASLDLARHWDVAVVTLKITGETNIRAFKQWRLKLKDMKVELPIITGKHQEMTEYLIARGLREGAAKGLSEGDLKIVRGSLKYSMLGYEALLNTIERKKRGDSTLFIQYVTKGCFERMFYLYKNTTPEEVKKSRLPWIELKDSRVVVDSTVDSGPGMSGGPVYLGWNKQQIQLALVGI